ncbi:Gfo/Idh/MocA family oxidoreductase [Cohnella soli]|uniref:Gfo/Idh/MocA family oxidoreductase n=1 Tax=Cohnella soli TaxID=425005 RepID=A0ABW0HZ60_9BACL
MKKIGFIDYYLDEWHAQQYPDWIRQASGGEMEVAYAYGKIDAANGKRNADWCREKGIHLLDSIEEVVAKSDYLVVLSPDNPEQHEELAALPLQSGKPTYVDKTFAPDRAAARRMFASAEQHGTPLYSSSALRFAAEYVGADRQGIERISSIGPGKYENYSIHQIEPIVSLMGSEAQKVMYIGTENSPALLIEFSGGRQAEVRHMANSPFSLSIGYESDAFVALKAESDFFSAFIQNMVHFFRTAKPTVDPKETIAIITLIEYGAKAALTPFRWVELP